MKSDLSSFLDDELPAQRQMTMFAAIDRDEELRRAWDGYQLIGDALRCVPGLERNLVARVMAGLEREPVVLAPQLRPATDLRRSLLAIAATAAGVALVSWVALNPDPVPSQVPSAALATAQPAALAGKPNDRMQEYLVAHQTYSPTNRIQGGTSYVRTVSATRNSATK
jgi:sigma-E factor negative regulatory protein RseA